jgi:dihydroorotate dehydrogenase (NAD+) catalytic subunit
MNAAGVLGISTALLKRVYEGGAGAVVTKSLGPEPRSGHLNPTMVIVEGGILNAMGLPNPGAEYFVDAIKGLKADGVPVVASFFGASIDDFRDVAEILSEAGVDALEVNVSCPNVQEELGMLGADCINTEKVTTAVKEVSKSPVFVKLSPNVTDRRRFPEAYPHQCNGGALWTSGEIRSLEMRLGCGKGRRGTCDRLRWSQ